MEFKWALPPEPIRNGQIARDIAADIVVIGAGHAGTCAARAACESGASVAVLERQPEDRQRILGVGEIGHINSKWQEKRGVPKVDIGSFVNDWQLRTGNHSDIRLIRKYAENSGLCFDWFIEPLTAAEKDDIHAMLTPRSPFFPESLNGLRAWSGTANMGARLQNKALKANQAIAAGRGALFSFGIEALELVKEDGRVTGALARNEAGEILRFSAKRAVVLAAGDYSGNREMCKDLLAEAADLIEPGADFSGHGWDGSGIRMGMWAGGRLEPRPHAAMGGNYSFPGFDLIGSTAVLRVNKHGERYSNEGFGTHILAATAGARQPDGMLWGVFDSNIAKQAEHQAPCHAVFDYTEQGRLEKLAQTLERAKTAGAAGIQTSGGRPLHSADTIEGLAARVFAEAESRARFIAAVQRYNELCRAGHDADFGKDANLLQAIEKPPFYACGQMKDSRKPGGQSLKLLVTVSGLMIDKNQQALGDRFEPIPGLYATGNCSGGRFGTAYTTSMPGQSIGMAQTLGMALGRHLAAMTA